MFVVGEDGEEVEEVLYLYEFGWVDWGWCFGLRLVLVWEVGSK